MSISSFSPTKEQQQVYALSEFAGLADETGGDPGKTYAAIKASLSKAAPTIGAWNVVWGPGIVEQPIGASVAMNTMYVAQSAADASRYVVSIAGTNPYSMLDWIVEDGLVSFQVPWVYGFLVAPDAKISLGTAIGLAILQNLKPASSLPGAGTSLIDFLSSAAKNPIQLMLTGHSLAGALSPTAALWLADTQGIPFLWDPHKNASISTMPTAGPTAGNGAFAAYSGKKLGSGLTAFYNTLDVVPHAWLETGTPSLAEIPSLYSPTIPTSLLVQLLADTAGLLAKDGDYTTLPGLTGLTGAIDKSIIDPKKDDFVNFLTQLAYQHTIAYYTPFGFDAAWLPSKKAAPTGLSPALASVLSQKGVAAADVAQSVRSTPRKLLIGDSMVDAPKGMDDARGPEAVALVTAELRKNSAAPAA